MKSRRKFFRTLNILAVKATLVLTVSFFSAGCYAATAKIKKPFTVKGFSSPESVIPDPQGKRFFVSNVGVKLLPSAKDGDGFISVVTADGELYSKKYLPKEGVLNAPKGMAVVGKILYVTDIDRVVGFDIETRDKVFELDFSPEKTQFLNDIAVLDSNNLFVSATDTGNIYKVSINNAHGYTVVAEGISGPNGLYFDRGAKKLYVVEFGEWGKSNGALGYIDISEGSLVYRKLTGPIGALDGLQAYAPGKLLFSDWVAFDKPGRVNVYDINTKEVYPIKLSRDVAGPADFYYDNKKAVLWVPAMLEGELLIETQANTLRRKE